MRDDKATLAFLRAEAQQTTGDWYQMCLKLTRMARGVDSFYASALQAWNGATDKHPLTPGSNFSQVPIGAPIFYRSATYGHIVTFNGVTNGEPMVWSNDVAGRGKVSLVPALWFISHWGQPILGWTGDLNGAKLPLEVPRPIKPQPKGTVSTSAAIKAAKADPAKPGTGRTPGSGDDVLKIEKALVGKGLLDAAKADGHYGSHTIEAYKKWQRRLGFTGKDADGIPGTVSLRRLAEGQAWRVIP